MSIYLCASRVPCLVCYHHLTSGFFLNSQIAFSLTPPIHPFFTLLPDFHLKPEIKCYCNAYVFLCLLDRVRIPCVVPHTGRLRLLWPLCLLTDVPSNSRVVSSQLWFCWVAFPSNSICLHMFPCLQPGAPAVCSAYNSLPLFLERS